MLVLLLIIIWKTEEIVPTNFWLDNEIKIDYN